MAGAGAAGRCGSPACGTVKLIVGLGNPGAEYRGTRHNVGFEVLDETARRWGLAFRSAPADAMLARSPAVPGGRDTVLLAKPQTYMNRSGFAVGALLRYYRIGLGDLLVVTEDVNLPLGRLRARRQGSAGGHNGLRSILDAVAGGQFSRLRVGVGRGDPRQDLSRRVLSRFNRTERPAMDEVVQRAADAVEMFVDAGIGPVMNTFNRQETEKGGEKDPADCAGPY